MIVEDVQAIRSHLDGLYSFFAERYLETSMLSIPHYYREVRPSATKTEIEAIALLSALYDFQMRVPMVKTRFILLVNSLRRKGLSVLDLEDQGYAEEIVNSILRETGFFP